MGDLRRDHRRPRRSAARAVGLVALALVGVTSGRVEAGARSEVAPSAASRSAAPRTATATSGMRASAWDPAHPLSPLTSPDVGTHCARDLGAAALTELFSGPIGEFDGADYQRAVRLPDDRVLWTFQDAFIDDALVHNAAMIQSGRCFTLLNHGSREWLLSSSTDGFRRWHWPLDGGLSRDGSRVHLFVVTMVETGVEYLDAPRPRGLRRIVLDAKTLRVVKQVDVPRTGLDLYGWSVTSDRRFTYLYSHCYRQFGFDTQFGYAACTEYVKLARVPRGRFGARREYWDGDGWTGDHRRAAPVVDESFVGSDNNPAQIRFDGRRFTLVVKPGDWWGQSVEFGTASRAWGPFRNVASLPQPLTDVEQNAYFASWVPWKHHGRLLWSISRNWWGWSHPLYRPSFHTVILATCGGRTATIVGTAGDDRIVGTLGPDVIVAGGGDDRVDARAGDDIVCLGAGRDRVDGGYGADEVFGGAGDDRIGGGPGPDTLRGQGGADEIRGHERADVVVGGAGDDRIGGGPGPDTLRGQGGADEIHGHRGADLVDGGRGGDLLFGDRGDDRLNGGPDDDHLFGGSGVDACDGGVGTDEARLCATKVRIP